MPETIIYRTADGAVWDATILPEYGANCVRLTYAHGGTVVPVLEDVALERILQAPTSCGMPILFPYAGRVAGGRFTWRGTTYRADPPRHGLVRQRPWEVIRRTDDSVVCQTTLRSTLDGGFPYHCSVTVSYRFTGAGLTVAVSVANHGAAFPYTFGLQPYFSRTPVSTVRVPARRRWVLDGQLIPMGPRINVDADRDLRDARPLVGPPFDDVFTGLDPDALADPTVTFTIVSAGVPTRLRFSMIEYPHVCVYTPPGRCAVCMEPYTGAPDALNHADDLSFGARVLPKDSSVAFGPIIISCSPP